MPRDLEETLAAQPTATRLAEARNRQSIVALRGIVGPSAKDTLRLYAGEDFASYLELARGAVVDATREGSGELSPVTVYVPRETRVTWSMNQSAGDAAEMGAMDILHLQDAENQRAQLLQMLSNAMKTINDTSRAVIQNLR